MKSYFKVDIVTQLRKRGSGCTSVIARATMLMHTLKIMQFGQGPKTDFCHESMNGQYGMGL